MLTYHHERQPLISVVIPTLDAAPRLAATLTALVPAAVDGLVREVIVSDGGSRDATLEIADAAGATVVKGEAGRGAQLERGAEVARCPWLLFLHADTVLEPGWTDEVYRFIEHSSTSEPRAAAFRLAFGDDGIAPRLVEAGVRMRCRVFKLPYGDQGLLIPRVLYDAVGGFSPLPIMEDVDIIRRIGRRRVALLRTRAVTSAERYRRIGYVHRVLRNWACLTLWTFGVSPARIQRLYER